MHVGEARTRAWLFGVRGCLHVWVRLTAPGPFVSVTPYWPLRVVNEEAHTKLTTTWVERLSDMHVDLNEEYDPTEYSFASRTDKSNLSDDAKLERLYTYGFTAIWEDHDRWLNDLDSEGDGELVERWEHGEGGLGCGRLEILGRVWVP